MKEANLYIKKDIIFINKKRHNKPNICGGVMRLQPGWKVASLLSGVLGSTFAHSAGSIHPLFLVDNSPPPGFEALSQPQRTMIDIYYGDRLITTQMATYTPSWIKLSNPQRILEKISGITAPQVVLAALSGSINTNNMNVCHKPDQQNCGILSPKVAGVIFNESSFRLNIFINPAYLKLNPAMAKIFLPASDGDASIIQQFDSFFSGSKNNTKTENDYTITGNSLFAYKENNIQLNYDYSKAHKLSINNVVLEREFQGKLWQTGLLNTNGFGMAFSSDNPMWGVRLASSDDTRVDRGLSEGTPLQIFMPVRGRIDVLRDGRLIYTTFEEAGNHLLNTSGFPAGSYNITLRARDSYGRIISEQTRFFARDLALPKKGAPDYFFEAGNIIERQTDSIINRTTSHFISRAGINYRLANAWAGTAAVAATQDHSFAEFSIFNIGKYYTITPGFMISPDKSHGIKLDAQLLWQGFAANFNYKRLYNNNNSAVITTSLIDNGIVITSSSVDDFNLLQNSFEQASVSFSVPMADGRAGYRSTYRRQEGFESTKIQALNYSKTLYSDENYTLDSNFTYSQSDADKLIQLTFTLRWNTANNFSQNLTVMGQWQKQAAQGSENALMRDYNLRYQAGWNSRQSLNQDIDAQLLIQESKDVTLVQQNATVGSSLGAFSGIISGVTSRTGDDSINYGASLSTSFAVSKSGLTFGGQQLQKSGLVIDVQGADKQENFNVMADGQRVGVAKGNDTTLVPLAPFETYNIKIAPKDPGFYNFNESARRVTLYPGNVVNLNYKIKSLQLVFGRLLNKKGLPVFGAQVANISGINNITDSYGLFQFEVPYDTKSLMFKMNDKSCVVDIPQNKDKMSVLRVGTKKCHNF